MRELKDLTYLQMAYALAEKALGRASPNPYVGTVLVKNNRIIGHGYHEGPGKPHAEVVACQKAGSLARNSTVYVTLEPCVHWGRTPPCAETLLKVEPKRIVVSALDPNPVVFKKGIKKIREAGIDLSWGLLEERNRRLNEAYIKYITRKIPFVVAKAASSLDGKIATRAYSSQWISSSLSREYIHLLRGECDAIMVGINTIIRDDPQLTVRHRNWKGKTLARIILDSNLRFPLTANILNTLSLGKIFIFTLDRSSRKKAKALREKGVEVVFVSGTHIGLKRTLFWLGERNISSVLVEGGGTLLTSMIEERLVDKILLTISPKLVGGKNAPSLLQGEGVDLIKDALRLKRTRHFSIGEDIIYEGYF
jgi:diaminohydroxyphosphoribosylaminopyrimidine deaminase/5-amino-6-(5-phosphoribosylamino)uracil reductase